MKRETRGDERKQEDGGGGWKAICGGKDDRLLVDAGKTGKVLAGACTGRRELEG